MFEVLRTVSWRHWAPALAMLVLVFGLGFRWARSDDATQHRRREALSFVPDAKRIGEILIGQPVDVQFGFMNQSDRPVEILRVDTDCGCAVASVSPSNLVAPGASGLVVLRLQPTQPGILQRRALVHIRGVENPIVLSVDATIVEPIVFSPSRVALGQIAQGQEVKFKIALRNNMSHDLLISSVAASPFQAEPSTFRLGPGDVGQVTCHLASQMNAGPLRTEVRIHFDSAAHDSIAIPVEGLVHRRPIFAKTESLSLGIVTRHTNLERQILFHLPDEDNWRIQNVAAGQFQVSVAHVECESHLLTLRLAFRPNEVIESGPFEDQVVVHFRNRDERDEHISLRVVGFIDSD